MIDKTVPTLTEAMAGIADGATILIGGFGSVGQPDTLIEGLIESGAGDLVVVVQQCGNRARPGGSRG